MISSHSALIVDLLWKKGKHQTTLLELIMGEDYNDLKDNKEDMKEHLKGYSEAFIEKVYALVKEIV
jgi:hypothetical protein